MYATRECFLNIICSLLWTVKAIIQIVVLVKLKIRSNFKHHLNYISISDFSPVLILPDINPIHAPLFDFTKNVWKKFAQPKIVFTFLFKGDNILYFFQWLSSWIQHGT